MLFRDIKLIISLLPILLLCSCTIPGDDSGEAFLPPLKETVVEKEIDSAPPQLPVKEEILYEKQIYQFYEWGSLDWESSGTVSDISFITSRKELESALPGDAILHRADFQQKVEGLDLPLTGEECSVLFSLPERYDGAFFENHDLILVRLSEGAHGMLPYISSLTRNTLGEIEVSITTCVSVNLAEGRPCFAIVAELDKGEIPHDAVFAVNQRTQYLPYEVFVYEGEYGVYCVANQVVSFFPLQDEEKVGLRGEVIMSESAGYIEICYYKGGFSRPDAAYTEERTAASGTNVEVGFDTDGTWKWVDLGNGYGAVNYGLTEENVKNDWIQERTEAYGVEDGIMDTLLNQVLCAYLGVENRPESIMFDWQIPEILNK